MRTEEGRRVEREKVSEGGGHGGAVMKGKAEGRNMEEKRRLIRNQELRTKTKRDRRVRGRG